MAIVLLFGALSGGAGAAELGPRSVALAEGTVAGGFNWTVRARAPRPGEKGDICISATLREPPPEEIFLGPLRDGLCLQHRSGLLTEMTLGNENAKRGLIVLPFSPNAVKAFVDLGKGGAETVPLTRLSAKVAAELGIPPVSVVARGFVGNGPCIRRVLAFDANGDKLPGRLSFHTCVL